MSLVGTRPILPDELEQYELHHRARIAIKPGITGMWQVSGRSDITDFEEIVRLDPHVDVAMFCICKSDGPFLKMDLVKFLFCIHEMILLDKMNTNRANRANCTNSCLEMLLERLSQKCAKMNRY